MSLLDLQELNREKNTHNFLFTSREVIEIQSSFFYSTNRERNGLGFTTLAEMNNNYASQIYKFIHILNSFKRQKKFEILELGGGTGKFCQNLTRILDDKSISYTYTLVDLSLAKYEELRKKKKDVVLVKKSFEDFSRNNKKNFDILIMNEAMDMWSGDEIILDQWDDIRLPFIPHWVLIDNKSKLVKKKHAFKIKKNKINSYRWKLVFFDQNREIFVFPSEIGDYRYKIRLPDSFFSLLKKINLFSVVHDYWVFESDPNPIRSFESVEVSSDSDFLWRFSEIIPFGRVDVTYSPDQSEFMEKVLNLGLNMTALEYQQAGFNEREGYYVAEKNNETFIVFTTQVASEVSGRSINF